MSLVGTHVPGLSCEHKFSVFEQKTYEKHGQTQVKLIEVCKDCGASCTRGDDGLIVEYDALFNWGEGQKDEY